MDVYSTKLRSKGPSGQSSGRGLRLSVIEERCMVNICLEHMSSPLAQDYRKCFWEKMTGLLYQETGREYSWQSCKRQMTRLLDTVRMHSDMRQDLPGNDTLPVPTSYNEYLFLDTEVVQKIESFFRDIVDRIALQEEIDEQEERERKSMDPKVERVETWLSRISPPDELESIKDESEELGSRPRPSKRNRSRSPCPAERKHRPRSRSPLARWQETPVMARGALQYVKPEASERKPRLPSPSHEAQQQSSPESHGSGDLQFTDDFDDAAMRFCETHMHPLIRNLTSHNPVLQNESLDMADNACRAMFESVVSAATKHITDNFDLKPRT